MKGWTACNSHLIVVAVHDILCMLEELQGLLAYPGMFVGSQLAACNTKCHKLPTCIRNPSCLPIHFAVTLSMYALIPAVDRALLEIAVSTYH